MPSTEQLDALLCFDVAEVKAARSKTYIHDICEACGTTVKRV